MGSQARLSATELGRVKDAQSERVEAGSAVHLPLDQLEPDQDSGSGSFISLPLLDRESISSTAPRPLMHADCRTMLGPYVKVQSAETLHRLQAYLGAIPAQLAAFDEQRNRCGQGTAHVTLAPGRKNLLRLRP